MKHMTFLKAVAVSVAFLFVSTHPVQAGLTNGDFSTDLTGWVITNNVEQGPWLWPNGSDNGSARFFGPDEEEVFQHSTLSQIFTLDAGSRTLSFDLTMGIGGGETDVFTVYLLNPLTNAPLIFIDGKDYFFSLSSDGDVRKDDLVTVTGDTIWLDVSGLAGQEVKLVFDLEHDYLDGVYTYALLDNVNVSPQTQPDLKVIIWGRGRASPGETINYIIEYRNDGLRAAEESIIFATLDPLLKYVSGSHGADYSEFFSIVDWNVGTVLPGTRNFLYYTVDVPWGLPFGTVWCQDAVTTHGKKNLLLNGIDTPPGSRIDEKMDKFASLVNANRVPGLYASGRGGLHDAGDVQEATPIYHRVKYDLDGDPTVYDPSTGSWKPPQEVYDDFQEIIKTPENDEDDYAMCFTANENNGLTYLKEKKKLYAPICFAYSGGTRTAVTAILAGYLDCKTLVLISPMAGLRLLEPPWMPDWFDEMRWVHQMDPNMEIVIYQSAEDVLGGELLSWLFQVKFGPGNIPWIKDNNIKVNPGTDEFAWERDGIKDPFPPLRVDDMMFEIDQEEINDQDHGELFDYLFMSLVRSLRGSPRSSYVCTVVATALEPNHKYGPEGNILPGQRLDYKVESENEGEGIAFGVYYTDTLDEDLDDSTLEIWPVFDVNTNSQIAPPGIYNPATRTITWLVGRIEPGQKSYTEFSVNVRDDAEDGTEIINFATVYFPSVPEATRTNGVVSIVSLNQPPVANAGPDQTVEQANYAGTQVALDGSGSTDADSTPGTNDDITSFEWYEGTALLGSGQTLNHTFPLGSHTVTLLVTDTFGETDSDELIITIQDTTPPQFTLSVSPTILWPPNHKMVRITPSWTLHDICDSSPQVSLVSIVANEGADTIGDGHTSPDIEIRNDGSIYLRAERRGTGKSRIYTITYKAIDRSGNAAIRSAIVTVPHDQR